MGRTWLGAGTRSLQHQPDWPAVGTAHVAFCELVTTCELCTWVWGQGVPFWMVLESFLLKTPVTFQPHQHIRFLVLCIYFLVLAPGLHLCSQKELECQVSRAMCLAALRKIK